MARQVLCAFEKSAELFLVRDTLPRLGWPASRALASASARESERTSDAVDGSCLKGLFVGFGLEAFAALAAYGVWHVWQLLR
jgi:hypothetical protein